jgi:hypothetical protein
MAQAEADPVRWIRRGVIAALVVIGWVFIAWQNKFHVTAPLAFVCLGYLAVTLTIVNLWRTGAAAMSPEHEGEQAWARPIGPRGELDKEKKTLLKAIKEAEFDLEMGKLSKADADEMIHTYRARAIEVIKELERYEEVGMVVDPAGRPLAGATVRDQIAWEVKARLELEGAAKPKKKKGRAEKPAKAAAKVETVASVQTADQVATAVDAVEASADKVETASDKVTTDADVDRASEPASDKSDKHNAEAR